MKLSLAWIFDHLKTSWNEHDIPALMRRFNTTTAEIDSFLHIHIDVTMLTLAQVVNISPTSIMLFSPEHNKEYHVPFRNDVLGGQLFMLIHENKQWRWALEKDLGGSKETLLPALFVSENLQSGGWKKFFEKEDYILTVDNIALTHRPDMWSHRGFAREMGALLGVDLVAEGELFNQVSVKKNDHQLASPSLSVGLDVSSDFCKRFAALRIADIKNQSSSLFLAHRLIRVDSRPISAIVDATNYVMFDIGQPLHAFDAKKIGTQTLAVKESTQGQAITLLDGQRIDLAHGDIVITDGNRPLALAGIMGGQETAVQLDTTELYVEAASFAAHKIRAATSRYKIRTEASTRFEKNLDPQQNISGLLRFLKILSLSSLSFEMPHEILSLGAEVLPRCITISHNFIERMLGISLETDFVVKTLTALSFKVQQKYVDESLEYDIEVPTFRATKDVLIAQDIVEEVGRYFGFDAIPHRLPSLPMKPSDLTRFDRMNRVKNYCAYAAHAHEVRNYAVYDEEFLKLIQWAPRSCVTIKNPVSSTMFRLVTSLVPHLIKNVHTNATHKGAYNFFEVNKIWQKEEMPSVVVKEQTSLAGIFFDAHHQVDFYQKKDVVSELFRSLGMTVRWAKAQIVDEWFHPYQTAELFLNDRSVGFAGIANPNVLQKVVPGSAFIFELNADILFDIQIPQVAAKSLPKYQDSWRDISMLVPLSVTVEQVQELIKNVSSAIVSVDLVDFFQKDEWHDVRSLTIRFSVRDEARTLSSQDVDRINEAVVENLKTLGATIR